MLRLQEGFNGQIGPSGHRVLKVRDGTIAGTLLQLTEYLESHDCLIVVPIT